MNYKITIFFAFIVFCATYTLMEKREAELHNYKVYKFNKLRLAAVKKKKEIKQKKYINDYCKKIDKYFKKYGWGKSQCNQYKWMHVRNSVKGTPLIWYVYGDEKKHKQIPLNMTLIMCGVHGDEITPIKFCFDTLNYLGKKKDNTESSLVVVAPIVNPDSFFKKRPTRVNNNGVDINRNFITKDWKKSAIRLWKQRYSSDKRRFPGTRPGSEPEVVFQMNLIKRYRPNKIISVHAPLTILDYDGPTYLAHGKGANKLLKEMSRKAKGYKVKNYPFFPGSLGNWAGNERKIPTYTLELPSSDNRFSKKYWNQFKEAIQTAIFSDLRLSLKRP